nr:NADH dehydrogenase subunit 6 [Paradiplospinus antarcticus]
MTVIMSLFLTGLILGLVVVASNPSPYFAALGLVVVAGAGCGVVLWYGGSFLSLVLFLIYLGGMMVVFAYSAALAAEPYPEGLGSFGVLAQIGVYLLLTGFAVVMLSGGWHWGSWMNLDELYELSQLRGDIGGVALMYSSGGKMLLISGWVLLLTLLVVLEVVRGAGRGAVRAV